MASRGKHRVDNMPQSHDGVAVKAVALIVPRLRSIGSLIGLWEPEPIKFVHAAFAPVVANINPAIPTIANTPRENFMIRFIVLLL
jgi:hypothetical protein